jgi:hypothetical protein
MGRRVTLVAAAALALLAGTAGAAVVRGTAHSDLLRGTGGPDRIDARGGNDRIKVDGGGRDSVRCGRGRDLVTADPADRAAADCELVARVVARDPYGSPAQHSSIAEPDSFSFGNTVVAAFQVGRFRDGGAVAIGWATSSDRGRTWRSGRLPSLTVASAPAGPWQRASDPVVAYDSLHHVWLIASLAFSDGVAGAVVVSRSADGSSWSPPVAVNQAPWGPDLAFDKEWIVCDNGTASRFRGSCYATYSDLRSLRLEFQASRDGGLTWGPQVSAPGDAGRPSIVGRWAPAPQPVVQPDGDLIVPYYDETQVAALRSADGGASFAPPVTVADTAFKPERGLRAPPLPSAEVDQAGNVYVVWPDCSRSAGCSKNELVISRSVDGLTWSRPIRISTGPRAPQVDAVLPGIGADPGRVGRIAVTYYLYRDGTLDVGFITSPNGGRSWTPALRLNPESIPSRWVAEAGGAMVGDYISTSYSNGRAIPVFVLASRPVGSRLSQALFAASIR